MSTQYYLHGTVKWAKVHKPDEKYGNYEIDFYPDKDSMDLIKDSGVELKVRSDDDGKFVKLRRPARKLVKDELVDFGPPKVLMGENETFAGLIGNGSEVTVRVSVYDTRKGKGHRLEAIRVDNLVEYKSGETVGSAGEYPF